MASGRVQHGSIGIAPMGPDGVATRVTVIVRGAASRARAAAAAKVTPLCSDYFAMVAKPSGARQRRVG